MHYAFNENYLLPLSHDEVVPGKRSLLARMPGDDWKKFANLRLLYGYMYALPGKKLLFMGDEIGQWQEWSHNTSVDWHLLADPRHRGLERWVRDLNTIIGPSPPCTSSTAGRTALPGSTPIMPRRACSASFARELLGGRSVLVVCNFSSNVYQNFRVGVPERGAGKKSSTATPRSTAAAARVTWAA